MEKEEYKLFETLIKEGPVKTLKDLKDKVSYNLSFIEELNKENIKYKSLISMLEHNRIEETKKVESVSKRSVTMADEIRNIFKTSNHSKSIKDILKEARKTGINATDASIQATLSNLIKEGYLIRPEKGLYKINSNHSKPEGKVIIRNVQERILKLLNNSTLGVNGICTVLSNDNISEKTCKDALYNLIKKGEIEKNLEGIYSIKKKIPTLVQKVITMDTVKKCFETRKELTSKDLKKYLVDTKKMSYANLHSKIQKLIEDGEIIRLEVGKYRIKE